MARLRGAAPTFLGRLAVTSVTDFTGGSRDLPPRTCSATGSAGDRVVIRPSGTEPKIKAYLEVVEPVPPGQLGRGPAGRGRPDGRPAGRGPRPAGPVTGLQLAGRQSLPGNSLPGNPGASRGRR